MNEQGEIVYQWYGLHSDFNAGAWIEWWEKRVFAYSHCIGAYFVLSQIIQIAGPAMVQNWENQFD